MPSGPLPDCEFHGRVSVLEQATTYRLSEHSLILEKEQGSLTYQISDVVEIRCRYFPTRYQRNRYELLVNLRNGIRLKLCNEFYQGVLQFEDRSTSYVNFVKQLHSRVAAQNPSCQFFAGSSPASYWLNALLLGGVMLLILGLGITMFFAIPMIAVIKLVVFIFLLPVAWQWFKKNKPRQYDPNQIPQSVLP
ncbi:hypothetical protein NT6N_34340 [Oceaniferula spumae]|uniref:Uncharacterized protein n=1 Tax=Oceaniferula spumae TaxID=2979115 RepID=A0AAT9FQW5_9BACT